MSKLVRLLPGLVAGLSLLLATPAFAAKVYQWKDDKGVTHYSDAPPPDQNIKGRNVADKGGTQPQGAQQAAAKPVANANCSNARSNLSVLQGAGDVGVDEDKDGKPDRSLNQTERANRTALAEAQIKTYCDGPAVASGA
ncbi:DUF4124 domain-containing protein [Lysobacter auxotrophicus]|uniref:DUF4124 domain-containing protein n=1 Tax=Lysobacter auxotrophicus TaxID=2992573 RepID=A0ABN6UGU9_9GAMM|nr:DUF4124 domain-containing protein [Lysobacter auxotrophicus]BDU15486.1 DUF4124 domain-containing protein [Lysobacter auxotrophicus]